MTAPQRILQGALILGLFVVLAFGILAFGAVHEWSIFTFEAGAGVLFLVWAAKQFVSRQLKLSNNPLYAPASLFFVLVLAQIGLRTSAYGYVTKYEVLKYVSYGIVLLIAAECVQDEDSRKKFAFALIVFGALYAFFALAQELASNGKIFWFYTPEFHGSIYGSFVNHDHYAGCMEMLVPIPLVVSYGASVQGRQASPNRLLRRIDGQHDFSIWLAWWNDCFCPRNCAVRCCDTHAAQESSRSTRLGHTVYFGSRLPPFFTEGSSSGPTWRPGTRYPLEYHEGLLANVLPSANVGVGLRHFPNCLSRLSELLYQSICK